MGSHFSTTEALVIGSMRYKEADRIVTLYTRDRGRVGAIAKGVRRPKSKTGGRLEPFSLVRVSLHSGRGSLYTVVGVDTLRTFQAVRDQLFRMEEGARLFAAVRHLFPVEEGNVPAFNLLVRCLARLAESPDPATAAGVVLATRLKLLTLLGYAPEVSRCAGCGREEPLYGFSPGLGGVVCEACANTGLRRDGAEGTLGEAAGFGNVAGEEQGVAFSSFALSAGALATLRVLLENPLAELEHLDIDDRAAAEVEQVLTQTLAHHGH
jgi:DNA repair protein RecO (recombination protein O)